LTAAQYSPAAKDAPIVKAKKVARTEFDGKWMWIDASGQQQPQVTRRSLQRRQPVQGQAGDRLS
jgi:hypothetical protein